MSDMTGSARKGMAQVAGSFGPELQGAIRATSGLIQTAMTGGVYGLAAAAATLAVSGTIEWCQNLKAELIAARKYMDDMRNGYWALIEAQLAAKKEAEQSALDAIADKAKKAATFVEQLIAAMNALGQAEDSVVGAEMNLKIAQINDEFSAKLAEACEEMKPLVNAEKNLAIALEEQNQARELQKRAVERETEKLNDVQIKIERQMEVIDALNAAGKDTTEAEQKLAKLKVELQTQTNKLTEAHLKSEAELLKHETAVRDANAALANAQSQWNATVDANEKEIEALNEKEHQDREIAKITEVCKRNQVDANEYIQLWTECLKNGMTETEAYAELQKKLNEELQKRKEAEEKATEEAKKKAEEEAKKKTGKKDGTSSASATITFDPSRVAEGVKEWDGQTSYSRMRREMSNDI